MFSVFLVCEAEQLTHSVQLKEKAKCGKVKPHSKT